MASIGFRADMPASQAWASDHGLNSVLGMVDAGNSVAFHYDLYQFPGWLLLDSSGNLVAQGSRFDGGVQSALDDLG